MVHSTASREATERRRLHYIPLPRSYYAKATYTTVRSRCVEGAHTRIVCLVSRYAPCIVVQDAPSPSLTYIYDRHNGYIYFREHPVYTRARRKHTRLVRMFLKYAKVYLYPCVFVHRHDLRFRVSQEGATSKTN